MAGEYIPGTAVERQIKDGAVRVSSSKYKIVGIPAFFITA